jgi:PPM family protein phosphatase
MNPQEPQLEAASRTDIGLVREENQDCMTEGTSPFGRVFIVADGMGGHKGGAYAAKLVVQGLLRHLENAPADAAVEEVLTAAFGEVNGTVHAQGHGGDGAIEGMGSTAVLLLVSGGTARVAHVGDSRAYLFRGGALEQLTKDHTVVQRMVDAGMLKPEDAASHPDASVLDRALGNKEEIAIDISGEIPLADGDALLLCSDGLYGYVQVSQIEAVLRSEASVQQIPDLLVQLALKNGGGDNVTVQFIQYGSRKSGAAEAAARDGERATLAVEESPDAAPEPGAGGTAAPQRRPGSPRMIAIVLAVLGLLVAAGLAYLLAVRGTGRKPAPATQPAAGKQPAAVTQPAAGTQPAAVTQPAAGTQPGTNPGAGTLPGAGNKPVERPR